MYSLWLDLGALVYSIWGKIVSLTRHFEIMDEASMGEGDWSGVRCVTGPLFEHTGVTLDGIDCREQKALFGLWFGARCS